MECPICFDEIQTTNACTTPCGHSFCFKCVVKAMQQNAKCPCCREPLTESDTEEEKEEEDEDDSEYEEEEEEDADDSTIDTNFQDDAEDGPDIDMATNAFIKKGYDVKDALSLLLCRYSKTDTKYTREYISRLNEDFEDIMEELECESMEKSEFAKEDVNVLTLVPEQEPSITKVSA